MKWILKNKEWLFSGLGLAIIGLLYKFLSNLDINLISWLNINKLGILLGSLVTIILEILLWLLARNVFDGINQTENLLDIQVIQESGITAFYTCRQDYNKYRKC